MREDSNSDSLANKPGSKQKMGSDWLPFFLQRVRGRQTEGLSPYDYAAEPRMRMP
jgi:hypothetical protein